VFGVIEAVAADEPLWSVSRRLGWRGMQLTQGDSGANNVPIKIGRAG